jgi:hypothetical protein
MRVGCPPCPSPASHDQSLLPVEVLIAEPPGGFGSALDHGFALQLANGPPAHHRLPTTGIAHRSPSQPSSAALIGHGMAPVMAIRQQLTHAERRASLAGALGTVGNEDARTLKRRR